MTSAYAAEVFYLGGGSEASPGSYAANPQFTLSQRVKDLVDLNRKDDDSRVRSGRVSGSFLQEVDWNDVGGNTSKSFLERGVDYLTELNLNMQEKLPRSYQFEGQWFIRKTDNRRIEPRRDVRLKQVNLKVYNPNNIAEFGDFYGDFSQFTLGSSLEGASVEISPSEVWKFKTVAARSAQSDVAADKFQRDIFGAKVDRTLFKDSETFSMFRVGAQVVHTQDNTASLERTSASKELNNIVASVDGEIAMRKVFSLLYEISRSSAAADMETDTHQQQGVALRMQPQARFDKVSFRYLYNYIQPKFYTDVGSASPDKIQHQMSVDMKVTPRNMLTVSENYYWDHLTGSTRTKRTLNDEKYLMLTSRPFEARKDFSLRPYLNYQVRSSDDPGNTAGAITRTVGFSVNDVLPGETSAGFSYEYRGFTDTASRSSSDYFHRIGLNVAREQQFFKRRLYYSLDPSLDLRSTKTDDDKDVSINVGFNMQYDLASRFIMRAGNSVADTNGAKVATDYFNNRGYWEFDYVLGKSRSAHLVLRGERNNYTSENGSQSYKEQRIVTKFMTNF